MKEFIFSFIANCLNTDHLCNYCNSIILHPFYHTITDNYLPHIYPLYKPKSFKSFKEDIDYLSSHFRAVDSTTVFSYTQEEKNLKETVFHLSFDDGLREVYLSVLPFLYQKGIPATIFINKDFVDNQKLFYRHKAALIVDALVNRKNISDNQKKEIECLLDNSQQKGTMLSKILSVKYSQSTLFDKMALILELDFEDYLKHQQPYLTTEELKEMQKKGFTIGAHSVDHPFFPELTPQEQICQILDSVSYVNEVFGEVHSYFSFPFSDDGIAQSVFQSIYKKVDLTFGIGGIYVWNEGKHVGRIDMEKYGKDAKEAINKAIMKYIIKR